MRSRILLTSVVLGVLLAALPAAAGTPADPEVGDPCGSVANAATEPAVESVDVCGVWFSTPGTGGLTLNLSLAAPLQPRAPSFYAAVWNVGGCRMNFVQRDGTAPGDIAAAPVLHVGCDPGKIVPCDPEILGDLGYTCFEFGETTEVSLAGAVQEDGQVLRADIQPEALPAQLRHLVSASQVVTEPYAYTGFVAAGAAINGGAQCGAQGCTSRIGDYTVTGRAYTIGS